MTEQPARDARAMHEQPEHLTFAEAAERLNITANAVRMRVHRGSLVSVRMHERTFVVWPQPAQEHAQRKHDARADEQSSVQNDDRLIARLESENAYLRQTLDAEIEARRRADHLVAGMIDERGALVAKIAELQAGAITPDPSEDAPVGPQEGRSSTVEPLRASDTLQDDNGSQDNVAMRWRKWWRRVLGHER